MQQILVFHVTKAINMEKFDWFTYAWIAFLSIFGGTAYNIKKLKQGDLKRFSISEWVGDITIAGFIGLITFYLCQYSGFEEPLTGAIVGIAAHQGTRGISILESIVFEKLGFKNEFK